MFRSGMLEEKESKCDIPGFQETVVKGMLEFIYTGTTTESITPDHAEEWLRISHMYQLDEFKNVIEDALCECLTVENVLVVFTVANLFKAHKLEAKAVEFFKQ